jgi:hypothetical protein
MSGPTPLRIDGGMLSGDGTITGNVQINGGTVEPGLPIGSFDVIGNHTQESPAAMVIDVSGLDPGLHDSLHVSGDVSLAGELEVVMADAFSLREGDYVTVLTGGVVTGEFDSVVAPPEVTVAYLPTEVRVGFFELDDFDYDGDSDLLDMASFQLCFGGAGNPPSPRCPPGAHADVDGDGDVDFDDYASGQPENNTGPR